MKTVLRLVFAFGVAGFLGLSTTTGFARNSTASGDTTRQELCQEEIPGTINPTASFLQMPGPGLGYNGAAYDAGKNQEQRQKPAATKDRTATKPDNQSDRQVPANTGSDDSSSDSDDAD